MRPCLSPRFAWLHRRTTALGGAYLAAYASVSARLALWSPWPLVPVAAAAAAGSGYQLRRARARYGASLGLPPGSLPLVSVDPRTDRRFFAKRIARYGAVSKAVVPQMFRPVVCVAALDRGAALLREHEYAPFGMLNHACLGASTTVRLAETFVLELSRGYDLELVRDGPPVHDGYHWRPSFRHRVTLQPCRSGIAAATVPAS